MSGVDIDGREIRKGAREAIARHINERSNSIPLEVLHCVEEISNSGGTPLLFAENRRVLGVIAFTDVVKGGTCERFDHLRAMGIRTMMITGDNPLAAAAIARQAGVDDFLAEARGISRPGLHPLIHTHIIARQFGFLGEPRVNVLELNLALDAAHPWHQAK